MAERTEQVTLIVDGQRHEGWTSVEITRGLDAMVGTFDLELTESWSGGPRSFKLEAGAAATVQIAGETVITGWIERVAPSIADTSHTIMVSGSDRACDLVQCSAIATPASWRGAKLEEIAAELAAPFGVTVTAKADTGPAIKRFAIQQGETVQEAIERLCRFVGLLAISTPDGNVELVTPATGAPVERFVQGETILAGSAAFDTRERYSEYLVKGQASGDDDASGKTVSQPKATATDPAVKRHRPLLVVAEDQATLDNLQQRARWEASTRAGKAQPVTITAPGWRDAKGKLRARNTIVSLDAPALLARGDMLVESVLLSQGPGGTVSQLTLVPPVAWSQLPVPEGSEASRIGE